MAMNGINFALAFYEPEVVWGRVSGSTALEGLKYMSLHHVTEAEAEAELGLVPMPAVGMTLFCVANVNSNTVSHTQLWEAGFGAFSGTR